MKTCPQCNQTLADDAPAGLCPQCLMSAALEPGDRVQYFGNYELLEEIALGGMGLVWRAKQTSLNRVVALKMIRGGILATPEEVQRFHAEAEAAANLKHPNIVAIHEVGENDGQHYFSMDYIEGKNLADYCDGKPLVPARAAEWIATIADAVQFAHQRGILHRDLKPHNVMIDADGMPHLTDFGLAKRIDSDSSLTQTGAIVGSPSYMAPEQAQARADRVGPHTDVYSLGAMLYEMLTGRAPFRGESAMDTIQRVLNDPPVAPTKLDPAIPRDLETICLKCLEKSPQLRYATARDLAEDVRRFLRHEPIVARPASALRKAATWARRRPTVIAGAAAALIVALAGYAYYLTQENTFLLAQAQNPALTRQPGSYAHARMTWDALVALSMLALVWIGLWFSKSARRISWAEVWQPGRQFIPMQPVGTTVRSVSILAGLIGIGISLGFLDLLIKWKVWEGALPPPGSRGGAGMLAHLFILFSGLWMSVWLLVLSWRDHLLTTRGVPFRHLDAGVEEKIRAALEDKDFALAIDHYRRAVPEATRSEASDYALGIAAHLRSRSPEKFEDGFDEPRGIHWPRLLLAGAIGLIAIAALWLLVRPAEPGPVLYSGLCGLAFGGAIAWMRRVKGFAKRVVPVAAIMIAYQTGGLFLFGSEQRANDHLLEFIIGVSFGLTLLVTARTRRRG